MWRRVNPNGAAPETTKMTTQADKDVAKADEFDGLTAEALTTEARSGFVGYELFRLVSWDGAPNASFRVLPNLHRAIVIVDAHYIRTPSKNA
jgi:hypothetical protein